MRHPIECSFLIDHEMIATNQRRVLSRKGRESRLVIIVRQMEDPLRTLRWRLKKGDVLEGRDAIEALEEEEETSRLSLEECCWLVESEQPSVLELTQQVNQTHPYIRRIKPSLHFSPRQIPLHLDGEVRVAVHVQPRRSHCLLLLMLSFSVAPFSQPNYQQKTCLF